MVEAFGSTASWFSKPQSSAVVMKIVSNAQAGGKYGRDGLKRRD
ncbi:hypothetical protein [Streptomyces sp. NPDC051662]